MSSLRILLICEGSVVPSEILGLLESGSHLPTPVPGLDAARNLLSQEQFDAVLLSAGYPANVVERFASDLRELNHKQNAETRTVLLSCAPTPPECSAIEIHLSDPEDFAELAPLVTELASSRLPANGPVPEPSADLPIFEPESFEDQCAHDTGLMAEILDLFGAECDEELPVISRCLASEEFERASRVAHSLKGSLGSLHAARARRHAQDLEMAAREANAAACSLSLASLGAEIKTLRAHLLEFRQTCLS